MKALSVPLIFAVLFSFFAACVAPTQVDSQGNVVGGGASASLQQEGLKQWLQIKQQKKRSGNASYNAAVQRVGARLTRVIPMANANWEFVVFADSTPNAFALPGGKVGVNSGLFQITQNDAGLATVLAHEIAHVTANHAGRRRQQQTGLALGGALLGAVLNQQGASEGDIARGVGLYGTAATVGLALPFSRSQELEADRIGMNYMAKAGYNPAEAVNLWERFAAYNRRQGSSTPEFLRTHPLDQTRIDALKRALPDAQRFYR